jgi:hypothetical protein
MLMRPGVVVLALLVLAGHACAQPAFRTVILSGDTVPGVPGAATMATRLAGTPVINDAGQTAFAAFLTGAGAPASALVSEASGSLVPVAYQGGPAPALPGMSWTFGAFTGRVPRISDNGRVCITTAINELGGMTGVWAQLGAPLELVMINGGPSPTNPGGFFTDLPSPVAFNRAGHLSFVCYYMTTDHGNPVTAQGLFLGPALGLQLSERTEYSLATSGFRLFGQPTFNDNDVDADYLNYWFADSGHNVNGIYAGGAGGLSVVAAVGDIPYPLPPSLPVDTRYAGGLSPLPGLNNSNQVVFQATLSGAGFTFLNGWSLWALLPSDHVLLALAGDPVPGAADGAVMAHLPDVVGATPVISDSGHVAFYATLTHPDFSGALGVGLFLRNPGPGGHVRLIARTGAPIAGFPANVTINSFDAPAPTLNAQGQVLFGAELNNAPRTLFATDTAGRVVPLLRTGAAYTVRPGITATLLPGSVPFPTGGSDGLPRNFSDRGEYAFVANATAAGHPEIGSGVFVVRVPCAADFDGDGSVNLQDFLAFLAAFAAADLRCDYNGDAQVNVSDFLAFLGVFSVGCS